MNQKISKKRSKNISKTGSSDRLIYSIIILAVSAILIYLIFINRDDLKRLSSYGLFGIFVINFISSATVLLPAPGTATVLLGGTGYNPILVGLVSGLGASIGELFSYFLGFGGRGMLKTLEMESKVVKNLENKFHRSGFMTTLIVSFLPLPIFDFIGLIAGAVSYPVVNFFMATLLGRTTRNILFALGAAKLITL